jgi:hypothetical protein
MQSVIWRESDRPEEPPPTGELVDLLTEYIATVREDKVEGVGCFLGQLDKMIADNANHAAARAFSCAVLSDILTSLEYQSSSLRHFIYLSTINTAPFLNEVRQIAEEEWEGGTRHLIEVQRETRSVDLFIRATKDLEPRHDQSVRPSRNTKNFPKLVGWLQRFAFRKCHGSLQLARIVRLRPKGRVYPHVDRGLYYLLRDRCHIVLDSKQGSRMRCDSQESIWQPGEVWWFNNHVIHEAYNDSDEERVHVIFDILPERNRSLAQYLQQFMRARAAHA